MPANLKRIKLKLPKPNIIKKKLPNNYTQEL